jgi:hypothetical protein
MSRTIACTLALLGLLAVAPLAVHGDTRLSVCGNEFHPQPSLRDQVRAARLVLLTASAKPREGDKQGDHLFHILEVLKPDPALGKTRTVSCRLHAYRPEPGSRWLFFCKVGKQGEIVPYRLFGGNAACVDYLRGLVRFVDDPVKALVHCTRYLEHPVEELAADAITELGRASDKPLRAAAQAVPADRVAGWLQDPKVHFHRHDPYGLLLGYCGDARRADVLRRIVTDPKNRAEMDTGGLLAGYVLLRPQEGWSLVQRILHDRSAPSRARASALSAVRFFWEQRTDVLPRADMLRALVPLLEDTEFADVIILDLRRWQRWELTDRVLARWDRIPPSARSNHYAIVAFAMCSPRPQAAAFVERLRRTDPDAVEVGEVVLRLERDLKTP